MFALTLDGVQVILLLWLALEMRNLRLMLMLKPIEDDRGPPPPPIDKFKTL